MKRLCLLAVLLFAAPAFAGYGPPLDLPENDSIADPMVLEVDGLYHLYGTTSWTGFEAWTSPDLETWTYAGFVYEAAPEGSWNDGDLWAPEVHTDGERFFLYYSANMMLGVAVADDPLGPFVDVFDHPFIGSGYGGINGLAIDGHVFVDDDGARYFYFTGYTPFSSLLVAPMTSMTELAPGPHPILVETGIFNWEVFVVEAPWMVKHEGAYFLMYSGGGANVPLYAIGYAAGDDPLGPFDEYAGNPIFHRDDAAGIFGPGHHCTVDAPDGTPKIVYHTKQEAAVGWDREIRINDLCFTESGRLYVGLGACDQTDPPTPTDDDDDDSLPVAEDDDDSAADDEEEEEEDENACGG
jgi:xylan 1,4-beta-xylosidase